MEHQGDLLVGVAPCLVCDMLLGHDWTLIYDVLERVQDAESRHRQLRDHNGWLGELEDSGESAEDTEEVDLCDVVSGLQFREA